MTNNVYSAKVSRATDPAHLATSALIALKEGKVVRMVGMGIALTNIVKSICYLKEYNNTGRKLLFEPITENVIGTNDNEDAIAWGFEIELSSDNNKDEVSIETLEYILKVINPDTDFHANEESLKDLIARKNKEGYKLITAIPVVSKGETQRTHLILRKA